MKKVVLLEICLMLCALAWQLPVRAQHINIGIYYRHFPAQAEFTLKQGKMAIVADKVVTAPMYPGQTLRVRLESDSLNLWLNGKLLCTAGKVKLLQAKLTPQEKLSHSNLKKSPRTRVNMPGDKPEARVYDNGFKLRPARKHIQIINFVDFKYYLAGVTEAESGYNAPLEFYKAQAVLARTFAYKNLQRHEVEGFNLCDRVHCQAYHGRTTLEPAILKAVEATSFEVVVTDSNQLIDALFSANCGGQTANPQQVWYKDFHYLKSIKDPYCRHSQQRTWRHTIALDAWRNYLVRNGWKIPKKTSANWFAFNKNRRKTYYRISGQQLAFHKIRNDWGLRSSFFSVLPAKKQIVLKGRGYGHGVGLCQEGAMEMARQGKDYFEILDFYFQNIQVKRLTIDDVAANKGK